MAGSYSKSPSQVKNQSASPLNNSQGRPCQQIKEPIAKSPLKDETTPWIKCDYCFRWCMYNNTELKVSLGDFDAKKIKEIDYKCDFCTLSEQLTVLMEENKSLKKQISELNVVVFEQHAQMNSNLSEKVQEAEAHIITYAETVKNLTETVKSVETASTVTSAQTTKLSAKHVSDTAAEMNDIERRKDNIIVYGMTESRDDRSKFIDFANRYHILSAPLIEDDIISTERIGKEAKNNDKPRLLKLKFRSKPKRKMVLTMHHNKINYNTCDDNTVGGNSEGPKIYCRPDLTKLQQEADKELREEQNRLGKDKFVIFKGKVVPRDSNEAAAYHNKLRYDRSMINNNRQMMEHRPEQRVDADSEISFKGGSITFKNSSFKRSALPESHRKTIALGEQESKTIIERQNLAEDSKTSEAAHNSSSPRAYKRQIQHNVERNFSL